MSNIIQETDLVKWFGMHMYVKLRANSHKPHWGTGTLDIMFKRLCDEVGELSVEIDRVSPDNNARLDRIISECADIANFAAFIAYIANICKSENAPNADRENEENYGSDGSGGW